MERYGKNCANVCVNKAKKRMSILIMMLAVVFVLVGCRNNETTKVDKDGKKLLRIAYFPNVTHAQGIIMKEQGLLEKALGEEYKVSWVAFNAGPAEVEALFAGEIDMGFIGPVPAISANVISNAEFKIVSGGAKGGEALVTGKDFDAHDLNYLKGRKVAVPQKGNTQHLSLLALLQEHHLEVGNGENQVEIVEAENADILNLLTQGAIAAAMIPEPWVSIITAEKEVVVAREYDEIWQDGGNATSVVVAYEKYLLENKKVEEAFRIAQGEVTDFIQENKEEAISIVKKELLETSGKDIKTEVLEQAFSRIVFDTKADKDHIYQFGELSYSQRFIKKEPKALFYGE